MPSDNTFEIAISPQAEQDLNDIYNYIADSTGFEQANHVLMRLKNAILSLKSLPLRGNIPPELHISGITRYREIHTSPWRIIYEPLQTTVHIHWVFDSRRNVAEQLEQKILRP